MLIGESSENRTCIEEVGDLGWKKQIEKDIERVACEAVRYLINIALRKVESHQPLDYPVIHPELSQLLRERYGAKR